MAPGRKESTRRKNEDSSDNNEDISGDDVDQDLYSSESVASERASSEEVDSFIDDDEVIPNDRNIYREPIRENSDDRQYKRGEFLQNLDLDTGVEEIVKPFDTDPYLFRVPVRQGANLACLSEMTNILARGELTKNSDYPLFSAEVFGVMANPNDPSYVYVESFSHDEVEMLACQPSLKKFILPFRHYYSREPVMTKPSLLHEIRQVQRQEEGNICNVSTKVQKRILRNHYYVIKRFGFRNIYGGQLCRVYSIQDQIVRVLTLARARSFDNGETVEEHRFTKEMYQEENAADAYETEYTTESGVYFEGLALLDVRENNLREPLIQELANRNLLQLAGEKRQHIEILPELKPMDIAVIKDYVQEYKGNSINLEGHFGEVVQENGNYVELRLRGEGAGLFNEESVIESDHESNEELRNPTIKIPRNKLNRYIKEGAHVRIAHGEYENVVGTLIKIVEQNNTFVIEMLTDEFLEVIDARYQITTDYLEVSDASYSGFEERKFNNVLFQRNQLVKMPSGVDALVTNLSFKKAAVCTVENELKYLELADLQPVFVRSYPIFKDGQRPPEAVSVGSRVRVVDTDQTGIVMAVTEYSISYILFLKILDKGKTEQLGIMAVDSKKVIVDDFGAYVRKRLDSKNELWIGRHVEIKNPRFMGREGVIVGTEGDDFFRIKLAEMDVSVRRYEIEVIEPRRGEDIEEANQRIGASEELSIESEGFGDSEYAVAASQFSPPDLIGQEYENNYNLDDYGGFEGN